MELKSYKTIEALTRTGNPDDKIVAHAENGEHIPLTCINHPTKLWTTKNIQHIGARRIFYNLSNVQGMGPECDCPASCLRPIKPE